MKAIIVSIIILVLSTFTLAGEITLELDRVTLLIPNENDLETESSRMAILFNIPDSLEGKHIVYAEMSSSLDLSNVIIEDGDIIELQAHDITADWTEDDTWNSLAEEIDTLSYYSYAFEASSDSEIFIDVTKYIDSVVNAGNANFGLMLIPQTYYNGAFHASQSVIDQIRSNTNVKIVFQ